MAVDITYEVTIGSQHARSGSRESDRLLVSLFTHLGMDGGSGFCVLELADAEYTPPRPGDAVTVELDGGEGTIRVFSGEVDTVETTAAAQCITAFDGIAKLARLEIEAAYEEATVDDIVRDLMHQAGVSPGKLDKGPKLPSFALFKGPRALNHIRSLARLCGTDVYANGQGQVSFTGPQTTGTEHRFEYGRNVLELNLRKEPPLKDGIEIWGEGAAGTQGADKYFWLPDDLSGLKGSATVDDKGTVTSGKAGTFNVRESAAVLRSGEAVGNVAKARMQAAAARLVRGHIKVYGCPAVMPGDTAMVGGLPGNHSAADVFSGGRGLRIRNVRHKLDLQSGFATRMDF